MDKICDFLHKKAKMWLKVVINRHLDLKNGLNRQLSPFGTTYHHFWRSDHTWLNTVLTPPFMLHVDGEVEPADSRQNIKTSLW